MTETGVSLHRSLADLLSLDLTSVSDSDTAKKDESGGRKRRKEGGGGDIFWLWKP